VAEDSRLYTEPVAQTKRIWQIIGIRRWIFPGPHCYRVAGRQKKSKSFAFSAVHLLKYHLNVFEN
jgi:hypothetical protein